MNQSHRLVVHVADIELSEESGMGRIAWYWQKELERRGYEFIHIGPTQVGSIPHRGLFPYAAYQAYRRLKREATFFLVHEASSTAFLGRKTPTAIFSHGLDRRSWELALQSGYPFSWRSRLLFPLWRLRPCDLGIKKGNTLLFSNYEDVAFAQTYYHRDPNDIFVFRNGVYPVDLDATHQPEPVTVGFIASWLERKGIGTLVKAAELLYERGLRVNWLLAGTGSDRDTILSRWIPELRDSVEIIPRFPRSDEINLLARCNIFVLPSFYEGQPLSLLQAMEAGRCCITTDCCGQRDVIQHGDNGFLYPPGKADALADCIETCAKDRDLRLRVGDKAKQYVSDRRWETVSAEVVDRIEHQLGLTL